MLAFATTHMISVSGFPLCVFRKTPRLRRRAFVMEHRSGSAHVWASRCLAVIPVRGSGKGYVTTDSAVTFPACLCLGAVPGQVCRRLVSDVDSSSESCQRHPCRKFQAPLTLNFLSSSETPLVLSSRMRQCLKRSRCLAVVSFFASGVGKEARYACYRAY